MSKKGKKFEAEGEGNVATTEAPVNISPAGDQTAETKASAIPKSPSLFLEANGVQYKFTRFPLPKKCYKSPEGEFVVSVDNVDVPAWTTSSKGWAKEDATIDYIWLILPGTEVTGYLTCDYNQPAANYAGMSFTAGEGKANRDDPKRVPRDPAKDAHRIELFRATMAQKVAATPTTEAPTETQS